MDITRHRTFGLYKDHFGIVYMWSWKNRYLFLDCEDGSVHELETLDQVQNLGHDKTIFDERNYRVPKGDEAFTKRQLDYGKIHDIFHTQCMENGTNAIGKYTADYCRSAANLIAIYHYYLEIIEKYGSDVDPANLVREQVKPILMKYFFSMDSMYDKYCDIMNLCGENTDADTCVSEEEVIEYIKKVRALPVKISSLILNTSMIDNPEMHYLLEKIG